MARRKKLSRLVKTSQGTATDLPPEDFIPEELAEFGTTHTDPTYVANLMNWHPFYEELWRIEKKRYVVLEQSFRLSARLLLVGLPGFICNFLPKPQRLGSQENGIRIALFPRNELHMRWALHHLRTEIFPNLRFSEDADIWPDANIMSLTHTGLVMASDAASQERAEAANEQYRVLDITIASQIIDILLNAPNDTEQYMNALFAAAISVTREIAHILWLANPRNPTGSVWVGNDIESELGNSFLAHLFNGWYPEPILIGKHYEEYHSFKNGFQWVKMHRRPCRQPYALVYYSVPMDFIQKLFREESWAPYNEMSIESIDMVKQNILDPKAPFRIGRHARRARVLPKDDWKRQMTMEGYEETDNDLVENEADIVLYGPGQGSKVIFDSDWNETSTEQELAVENEKRRRYLININNLAYEDVGEIARLRTGDRSFRAATGTKSKGTQHVKTTSSENKNKKKTGANQKTTRKMLIPTSRSKKRTSPATKKQKVPTRDGPSTPKAQTDAKRRPGLRSYHNLTPVVTTESTSTEEAEPSVKTIVPTGRKTYGRLKATCS